MCVALKDHRHDCALQFTLAVLLAEHLGENPDNRRRVMMLWVERGYAQRFREVTEVCPEIIPEVSDTEGVRALFQKVQQHTIAHQDIR